jgi:hypothetical protein
MTLSVAECFSSNIGFLYFRKDDTSCVRFTVMSYPFSIGWHHLSPTVKEHLDDGRIVYPSCGQYNHRKIVARPEIEIYNGPSNLDI